MGAIAELVKAQSTGNSARQQWDEVFGRVTDKEQGTASRQEGVSPEKKRGWANSSSNDRALIRLLQALRSNAPGAWTDDRYEQSKHLSGIPYISIHRKGEMYSMAEFQVFIKDPKSPKGKREVTPTDEPQGEQRKALGIKPYDLVELLGKPNPDDGFGDLMYDWNMQMDLTGTSLTWIVPNVVGTPFELYPIPTATAIPQPQTNPEFPYGFWRIQPLYPYGPFSTFPSPAAAVGAPIPAEWVMKTRYRHPLLRYEGYSPQTAMRLHIDEIEMIDRARHASMRGVINPSGVLNFNETEGAEPLNEDEIERIRADFEATHQGPDNLGRLLVAAPGSELKEWGQTPDKMLFESGWDQLASLLFGAFGITKPAAGMVEDSSYSTLFATLKQLAWLTLDPFCNRIARMLTRYLAPFFGDNLIVEVRCRKIDDHDIMFSKIEKGLSSKCITKNEVRTELGWDPVPDQWGGDIAGDPSPGEKQAQQQQQAPPGGGNMEQDPLSALMGGGGGPTPDEARPNPAEIEKTRPGPGPLSEGALGPRKMVSGYLKHIRSKYSRLRQPVSNGRH